MPSIALPVSLRGQLLSGSRFSPLSLFTASEPGLWYDPSDLTTMFQDTAGTIPVTTPGQSVACINDKSGRGNNATQPTAASRPTYGVHPVAGVRNVAQGSADVGDATYWPTTVLNNGITATKIASGFDTDGLPYIDVRYQGLSTSTFHATIYATNQSRSPAVVGQTFTASVSLQRIGGSLANLGPLTMILTEEIAPTTFVNQSASPGTVETTPVMDTVSRTLVSGNQVRVGFVLNFASGAAIDATFRVKALQLELGSSRSAYQFNYNRFNVTQPPLAQVNYLSFDGVDDFLVTPTVTPGIDKVQVFAGLRKLSDAVGYGILAETGGGSGTFTIHVPYDQNTGSLDFTSRGTSGASATVTTGYAAPLTTVMSGLGDISGDRATLRLNSNQVAQNTGDQGTGNYLANAIFIGRRAGTSLPFNGNIYQLIVRFGANLDAGTISSAETFVNEKTGAY